MKVLDWIKMNPVLGSIPSDIVIENLPAGAKVHIRARPDDFVFVYLQYKDGTRTVTEKNTLWLGVNGKYYLQSKIALNVRFACEA